MKCQFTSEPAATCTACIKAGTKCTLAAPSAGASGNNLPTPVLPEDRLQRLENMLATLIQTQGSLLPVGLNSVAMPLLGGGLSTSLSHMPPFWEGMVSGRSQSLLTLDNSLPRCCSSPRTWLPSLTLFLSMAQIQVSQRTLKHSSRNHWCLFYPPRKTP